MEDPDENSPVRVAGEDGIRANRYSRRRHGHFDTEAAVWRSRVPGIAVQRSQGRSDRLQRSALPDAAGGDRGDPSQFPGSRGRRRLHEYVQRQCRFVGRLPACRRSVANQPRGGRMRPAGNRGGRRRESRTTPVCGRLHRPHQPHGVDVAGRGRSGLQGRLVRRSRRSLSRTDRRPDRSRRRYPSAGDHVRHAQLEGLPVRHRGLFLPPSGSAADNGLGNHHRSKRTHVVGANTGGFLDIDQPRRVVQRGDQLRAGRRDYASARGRTVEVVLAADELSPQRRVTQ